MTRPRCLAVSGEPDDLRPVTDPSGLSLLTYHPSLELFCRETHCGRTSLRASQVIHQTQSKTGTFESVALQELPMLYRIARRLTLDPVDAEDLVGQTLAKAAGAWKSFDGDHARSWLIKIMKNEHITAYRRKKARPEKAPLDAELAGEDPWEEVSWKAVGDQIWGAVDALPEDYRLTLSLCDVEELTYEQAAKAMDIPVGTVRSRLFRARRLLRASLAHLAPQV